MKAIRVHQTGGPEAMQLDEIPTPEPGPGEAMIEVIVSPGSASRVHTPKWR